MSRIEGGSLGRGTGFSGRSLGASSGGVGIASRPASISGSERSIATSFSSRNLGRSERPSLSFGPSTRPSLSLGQPDKPSLSFAGSRFESKRSAPDKSPGTFYTPKFKESKPIGETKSAILPRAKSDVIIPRRNPAFGENQRPFVQDAPKLQPKGLVTRAHLDNAVAFNPIRPDLHGNNVPASLPRPEIPVARNRPQVDIASTTPFTPDLQEKVAAMPTIADKAVPIIHRELIAPVKGRESVIIPRIIERKIGRTEDLPSTVLPRRREDLLIDEEKKKNELYKAEQLQTVAQAYVRAGLALNLAQGMRMTEKFLQVQPEILATQKNGLVLPNPGLRPLAPESPKPDPLRILQTAPVGIPEPGTVPQPQRAAITEAGAAAKIQTDTSLQSSQEASVQTKAKIQSSGYAAVDARTSAGTENVSKNQNSITIFSRLTAKDEAANAAKDLAFHIDKEAAAARLEEVTSAVDAVFPAFDLFSTASLDEVAKNMTGKSEKSKSRLAKLLNIEDGSEIWRKDVRGGYVTRGQAIQAAEIAIITKPPVDVPVTNPARNEKVSYEDVERVVKGEVDQDEYALAA